ncbi:MAG TPA: hypothetical protein VFG14_07820, partial [Chthoniobacteraceae bacterium]|nr:hypothetical protein [Chthoniobacteraceae bacterium]
RVVARDNRPDQPNEAVSATIVFTAPSVADAAKQRGELEQAAFANLQRVLELQERNITETELSLKTAGPATDPVWHEVSARQAEIRKLTRELLDNPLKPLGGLASAAQELYGNEMVLAVETLKAIPAAEPARRKLLADQALGLERKILRQLSFALDAVADAKVDRRVSGISAMIESLIGGQNSALEQTKPFAASGAKAGKPLVDLQDKLGGDMTAFLNACKTEAAGLAENDAALAETLQNIGTRAAEWKVRDDMIIAAERLDQNKPAEAIPLQTRSLKGLKSLQAMLDQVKLQAETEKRSAMLEAVNQAQEQLEKIQALHKKMVAAMQAVRGTKDKNDEAVDAMAEDYQEFVKNTKEAVLEVPKDLHIFADLNVANDLVEDVFSVFQEIEQSQKPKGEKKEEPVNVIEDALAKEERLLKEMGEAKDRLDAMEMWLAQNQDKDKVTTEAFDQAEMPKSGVALAELAAAAEDLVGDLLEEDKKTQEEATDGATNHNAPDVEAGGEVMEGDIASFAAQGKSGNQTPDHKEQDGRSNVGRQGMANGETAAGSGTVGKGDDDIEARRTEEPTQSGKVDLSGKADTKATGGGKQGTGKGDDVGMSGGAERMDSDEAGSWEGMAALMARKADAMYAQASLKNIRVDSLKEAAHLIRQSGDTVAQGNIEQSREFRKRAAAALTRAQAQLQAGPSGAMETGGASNALENMIQSGPDQAPPQYRDKVADYYKALNDAQ